MHHSSPSNFFITRPDEETSFLKVPDFGIASAPPGENSLDVTTTQSVMGTPAYMAPEQMRNARETNPRIDIWALGVVLYEMLEGRRPWASDVYPELCLAIGMDPPAAMQHTPEALRPIVLRCLESPSCGVTKPPPSSRTLWFRSPPIRSARAPPSTPRIACSRAPVSRHRSR